jgi:signal transduction histidine kinase/CheY-like chemotaxis protein
MAQTNSSETLLREMLALEAQPDREFVAGACRLVGARHLLLLAPVGDGPHRPTLATDLPEDVRESVLSATLDPAAHPAVFPPSGALRLHQGDLTSVPLARFFPGTHWCLVGVGPSWAFSALWFGDGTPETALLSDALLSQALLRRLGERTGSARVGAEAASEALTRLSHEFKTPLVSIKGYAELILDQDHGQMDPKMRQWVKRIAGGANRLAILFRKATAEARTSDTDTYEARAVDPAKWVERCVDEASALASGRQLTWSIQAVEALPHVSVDPEAAQDMLLELLQNAARATPDGGWVRVAWVEEDRDLRQGVRVTVEDSGVGVPLGAAGEGLFERFATLVPVWAHHSGEFEYGASGLGLGLPMARGVARAHGGEVWVEARGRDEETPPGVRFHVWLPRVDSDAAGEVMAQSEPAGRVLLLEPEAEAGQILRTALETEFRVVWVTTAAAARSAWADGEWVACILEPRVAEGGVALVQALRSRPGARSAAILTYSTAAVSAETSAWRAAGADSCVDKPARTRVLLQRLHTIRTRRTRQ